MTAGKFLRKDFCRIYTDIFCIIPVSAEISTKMLQVSVNAKNKLRIANSTKRSKQTRQPLRLNNICAVVRFAVTQNAQAKHFQVEIMSLDNSTAR